MLKKILLIIVASICVIGNVSAGINGAHGLKAASIFCPPSANMTAVNIGMTVQVIPGVCSLYSSAYVPASGNYSVLTIAYAVDNGRAYNQSFTTSSAYIDASKSINQQNVTVNGSGSATFSFAKSASIELCAFLVDSHGTQYKFPDIGCGGGGGGYTPLPPSPPIPNTSCTINNGNALSVSLGTLNRDEIPTVPDSGSAISKTVSVVCTGGTVSVNMQLNYTPISIGSSQAVKTSANGVGAAIFYGSKALSPSDVTSVNFLEGSNSLTLGFQAVRDSTVALKDIPTGAFTASAVLVMTQQ